MAEPTATPTGTQYNYYTHRDPLLHPPSPRCYTHRDPIATSIGNPLSHTQGIHRLTRRESTVTHTQQPTATPNPQGPIDTPTKTHCYTHRPTATLAESPLLHSKGPIWPLLHPQGPTATHRKSTATPTGTHCYTHRESTVSHTGNPLLHSQGPIATLTGTHCYTHRDLLLHP